MAGSSVVRSNTPYLCASRFIHCVAALVPRRRNAKDEPCAHPRMHPFACDTGIAPATATPSAQGERSRRGHSLRRARGAASSGGPGGECGTTPPAARGAGVHLVRSCRPSAQDRSLRRRPAGGAGTRGSTPGEEGNSQAGAAAVRVFY